MGCSPERQFEYRYASDEGDPDIHSMHHAEKLPQPQLRTKPFCLESHGPAFAPCNEHVHNNVSENQNLVDNTCNAVHVSGNVDFQPMVGSQYESDLAQLHNVFTQSLDSCRCRASTTQHNVCTRTGTCQKWKCHG